ncbi:hypothetical protein C7S17_7479 [Burkholderia thailandensis]|nr:hypothetical protein [Burkholderia thailandensis]
MEMRSRGRRRNDPAPAGRVANRRAIAVASAGRRARRPARDDRASC